MIVNAIVNNCDFMIYEPNDINDDNTYFQLWLVLTAPAAQLYSYLMKIDISRLTWDKCSDVWHGEMARGAETFVPVLLMDIFGGSFKAQSFRDIVGKPCRIQVEDDKVKAIGNFLSNEWIEIASYQEG